MKKAIFLSLICISNLVLSAEMPENKQKIWNIHATYSKIYNYRYARPSTNSIIGPELKAYLDTGNIACYTNSIGALVQRNLWKFIHLQTGFSISRRGYLDSYTLYSHSPQKSIEWIPQKVISIPLTINLIHKFKNSMQFGFGLGVEGIILSIREIPNQETTLKKHSSGFWGYSWNKNRKLDTNTWINQSSYTSESPMWNLQTHFGIRILNSIWIIIGTTYSSGFKFFQITRRGGDPTLNLRYTYETKSYFLSSNVSLAYSF